MRSHRGWDPGSLVLGRQLATAYDAPLIVNQFSRLLVDVNRSIGNARLFSEFSGVLSTDELTGLLESIYTPHRERVERAIASAIRAGACVVHVGVHSFVPRLNGRTRSADIGLLYDPQRPGEKSFCAQWQTRLRQLVPETPVRRNYPYLGKADGLTTHLRRVFKPGAYLGIELEVNQRFLLPANRRDWADVRRCIVQSLQTTIDL